MKFRDYTIVFASDRKKRDKRKYQEHGQPEYSEFDDIVRSTKEITCLAAYGHHERRPPFFGYAYLADLEGNIFGFSLDGTPFSSNVRIHGRSISHIAKSKKQLEQISSDSKFKTCRLIIEGKRK